MSALPVMDKCLAVYVLSFLSLIAVSAGVTCPQSATLIPQGQPVGITTTWSNPLPDPSTGLNAIAYASASSNATAQCCASGNITTWSIVGTEEYSYVGQITAYCQDGSSLQSPTYGYNGTASNCSNALQLPANNATAGGNFSAIAAFAFRQFLGFPASSDTNNQLSFNCPSGTQPIGFSASSSCFSLSGFQVFCGTPLSSVQQTQSSHGSSISGGGIAGIVIGALAGVVLFLLAAAFFFARHRRSQQLRRDEEKTDIPLSSEGAKSSIESSYLGIDSSMQVLEEPDINDAVSMGDLRVPADNASTFADLPEAWRIPLSSVRLHTREGSPVELGRGGFGVVYRALVRRDEAALKIVKGGGPEQQARLLHEIKVLELCKSSHIVQFFGYCVTTDGLLLAMEYMAGGTLYERLHRTKEYQWYNNGRSAMHSIAAGLFYLHDLGVAHLDMKSPNVLVGGRGQVKISDVGLGRLISNSTGPASTLGTFGWLSPEQILLGVCGLSSDIFALGVILHEVCTLEAPTRMLRPIKIPLEGPQAVQDLIDACLREDPQERPTIAEFCEQLARLPATA